MEAAEPGVRSGLNLELKARVADLDLARERALALGARRAGTERQVDRYFRVPAGRLKLRESSADGAHLIAYLRPEDDRFRESRFHRLPAADPDGLAEALAAMLGAGPRVAKTREVWWWRDVRIHLDRVDGRGEYVELEARVDAIGDPGEAGRRLERLVRTLGIEPGDVVNGSYGDDG